jgi:hypothetical protein
MEIYSKCDGLGGIISFVVEGFYYSFDKWVIINRSIASD